MSGSEQSMTVPSSSNSARITHLQTGVEYQFQVVVRVTTGDREILGGRSVLNDRSSVVVGKCSFLG